MFVAKRRDVGKGKELEGQEGDEDGQEDEDDSLQFGMAFRSVFRDVPPVTFLPDSRDLE
jgi:hypothetical protein